MTEVISESSPRAGVGLVSFQPSPVFCSSATPPAIVEIFSWSILSASTPANTFGLSGVASSSGFFASTKYRYATTPPRRTTRTNSDRKPLIRASSSS